MVRFAGDLADEHGLAAVTLKNIADRAGVTQPALYRHAGGIDDVWRELALSVRAVLTQQMIEASVGLSGDAAVAAVAMLGATSAGSIPAVTARRSAPP